MNSIILTLILIIKFIINNLMLINAGAVKKAPCQKWADVAIIGYISPFIFKKTMELKLFYSILW